MTTNDGRARPGISRRAFLRTTVLGAGAAVASGALGRFGALAAYGAVPNLAGKTAVVVGSGFGGAVAALRLGQAGVSTTVLERGRRWDVNAQGTTFCTVNDPDWRAAWFNDRPYIGPDKNVAIERRAGIIDRPAGDGIDAITGAGVGGGSLVFGAMTPQPRRTEFESVFPSSLSYNELDTTYWPRARAMLGCSPIPDDVLAHDKYRGARAWLQYCDEFGKPYEKIDMAVDWDVVRAELAGTKVASHTVGEGTYGNNSGSKNSVDRNYLPQAVATGRVSVLPLHEVFEVREVPGQDRFEVKARQIDEHGTVLATKTFVCDFLFMAAGSMFTSSLLTVAKHQGWLTRLNGETGKGWGNNGDFLVLRTNLRKDCGNKQGGPAVANMFDDANPHGRTVMEFAAAPFPSWLGTRNMSHLIMGIPTSKGSFVYDAASGTARLDWPYGAMETNTERAGRDLATRLWWETEGRHGHLFSGLPIYDRGQDLGARVTWHPLGGMVMGKACDVDGKVMGYSNLFVVDGSLLPGSTANANPALTITAIAERCLDRFVASWV